MRILASGVRHIENLRFGSSVLRPHEFATARNGKRLTERIGLRESLNVSSGNINTYYGYGHFIPIRNKYGCGVRRPAIRVNAAIEMSRDVYGGIAQRGRDIHRRHAELFAAHIGDPLPVRGPRRESLLT